MKGRWQGYRFLKIQDQRPRILRDQGHLSMTMEVQDQRSRTLKGQAEDQLKFKVAGFVLMRHGNRFGVSGKALDWFKSYFTGRSQRIKLGNCLSSRSDLSFGLPQGSILGLLLFTLYTTTPLSSLVSGHAIPHHLYADDSQLYVSFSSDDSAAALNGLQSCLASVQS